jgi:N-acetyl-gamma-glutamyl-phosphate reductase
VIELRVSVIGATGYAGIELIRLLSNHPDVELRYLSSESYAGSDIAAVFPHLSDLFAGSVGQLQALDVERIAEQSDVVFLALPAGVSTSVVPSLLTAGCRVIDLGGDHRLPASLYEAWYKKPAPAAEIYQQAVYGLTEINHSEIVDSQFVSNPGCYPTAIQLAILPAIQAGWVDTKRIIIDAKSGVSGAGRGLGLGTHYSEVNENLKAYKIGTHQHTPEIEFHLSRNSGRDVRVSFTPHLVPMTRGILATCYLPLHTAIGGDGSDNGDSINTNSKSITIESIYAHYCSYYEQAPFVRIRPLGNLPQTKEVYGTNYCDIGLYLDRRTEQIIVVSVIDNLVKGAAGQAVQNMNVMFGLDQTTGLKMCPTYP